MGAQSYRSKVMSTHYDDGWAAWDTENVFWGRYGGGEKIGLLANIRQRMDSANFRGEKYWNGFKHN